MEIVTTYGNTVFNDGTIKKQIEYRFSGSNEMVSMWDNRDTNSSIEWTMDIENLKITCVDYVKFGKYVGMEQINEITRKEDDMISRTWIRGRVMKWKKLVTQFRLIKDPDLKELVGFQLQAMFNTMFDDDRQFDSYRSAAILCMRDLDLGDEEE
jgi:hypothetical protein